ncbi:hypothetical protein EYF80_011442 [Liparis tanakae]|uniref:Uncharacterized protein n=1 Tax=Liparis tanakae TaxID=230148 RepID=A0A4Z2ILY0_9TELE|nr:hypothetical protein EYF80_011442 [Liparis tanakae]
MRKTRQCYKIPPRSYWTPARYISRKPAVVMPERNPPPPVFAWMQTAFLHRMQDTKIAAHMILRNGSSLQSLERRAGHDPVKTKSQEKGFESKSSRIVTLVFLWRAAAVGGGGGGGGGGDYLCTALTSPWREDASITMR